MSVPGYDYGEFLANVLGRFPRGFCWGCVVQPDERERCEADSMCVDAHHVLPKQLLKRERGTAQLGRLLMDGRNGVPVRRFHHDAIEARMIVPSLRAVPREAQEFATEHGLTVHLERIYGQGRRRGR